MFRVGSGYDVHALVEGLNLRLGGVDVVHTHGLVAHSDGDVLIHALCDALLGALAMGDIGQHFSDQEEEYKGVDSCVLLESVCRMVRDKGYRVGNVDCTVVAQAPKLSGYIFQMRERLAEVMAVCVEQVSVKATTTESLGFEGRKEGISCMATVLLIRL